MKNLFAFALAASLFVPAMAQEKEKNDSAATSVHDAVVREESAVWPAYFAIGQFPHSPDVIGLRITIPFSTAQDNVTGIDLGFWGRSMYFEGIQVNVLRNDVTDYAAAFQVGLYNSMGRGDLFGLQVGLWNEAMSIRGAQVGLVNVIGEGDGLQVGLINRAETLHGYQVGLINIIRDAEVQFFPVLNIGF